MSFSNAPARLAVLVAPALNGIAEVESGARKDQLQERVLTGLPDLDRLTDGLRTGSQVEVIALQGHYARFVPRVPLA